MIVLKTPEQVLERLRYNSSDMGELGEFVRLEYVETLVRQGLASVVAWAAEEARQEWLSAKAYHDALITLAEKIEGNKK